MTAKQILLEIKVKQDKINERIGEQLYIHDPVRLLRDLASSINDTEETGIHSNRHDVTDRLSGITKLAT